jgi:hypothetical protein
LLGLVYLFCVLAPAISSAFAAGARAAPCLSENEFRMGIVGVNDNGGIAKHVYEDGHTHDHSSPAVARDSGQPGAEGADPDSLFLDHHKKFSGGQCCGIGCVNALPATVAELARPINPRSICLSTDYRLVPDNTPPQRYRPPIA